MKLRVIDFETTGTDGDRREGKPVGIVEIGFTDIDVPRRAVCRPYSALVSSGVCIPPEARAVHHISEEDAAGGITPDRALWTLMDGMEIGDIFVAHNAKFEQAFFSGGSHQWICTLQCARHLWQDAPGHSNQVLRYWLGVDGDAEWPDLLMPPHRAGPDSYVTALIVYRMILEQSPQHLIQLTNTPVLMKDVPFGKYEGRPWAEMDAGYLRWCLEPARTFRPDLKDAITYTARHWLTKANLSGTPFA